MTPQDAPTPIRRGGAPAWTPPEPRWEAELRPARRWWRAGFDVVIVEIRGEIRFDVGWGRVDWRRNRDDARRAARVALAAYAQERELLNAPDVEIVRMPRDRPVPAPPKPYRP